jgi:hypothetical protein
LLTNIRLGGKGLPGKSTLAYYKHYVIKAVKVLTMGGAVILSNVESKTHHNFFVSYTVSVQWDKLPYNNEVV